MAAIRVVFQTNSEGDLDRLSGATALLRNLPGCRQAEDFRSVEFPENLLHLEIWESPAAWDAAWLALRDSKAGAGLAHAWRAAEAPFHSGRPASPKRTGQNGLEFYKQARFSQVDSVWAASDPAERAASIRWPAWGTVRIVIELTSDPASDPAGLISNSLASRAEPGCLQFEFFRSVDHPENIALIESWASPEIYDAHWMRRLIEQRAAPAAPRPPPHPRQYGEMSFEWYNQTYYAAAGDQFIPEAIAQRMSSVLW